MSEIKLSSAPLPPSGLKRLEGLKRASISVSAPLDDTRAPSQDTPPQVVKPNLATLSQAKVQESKNPNQKRNLLLGLAAVAAGGAAIALGATHAGAIFQSVSAALAPAASALPGHIHAGAQFLREHVSPWVAGPAIGAGLAVAVPCSLSYLSELRHNKDSVEDKRFLARQVLGATAALTMVGGAVGYGAHALFNLL